MQQDCFLGIRFGSRNQFALDRALRCDFNRTVDVKRLFKSMSPTTRSSKLRMLLKQLLIFLTQVEVFGGPADIMMVGRAVPLRQLIHNVKYLRRPRVRYRNNDASKIKILGLGATRGRNGEHERY